MRLAALRFKLRPLIVAELQRGAVVDGRQPPRHLALAPAVEFIGGLVAGIKPPGLAQAVRDLIVMREALRLPFDAMRLDAEPVEIGGDAPGIFFRRARGVGIVIAQHELAAGLQGQKPVDDGGAGIADVNAARGRGGKADDGCHECGFWHGEPAPASRRVVLPRNSGIRNVHAGGTEMKQRRIGQDGPLVGEVGFGAMSFAGFFGPTDMETSHRTLARALDLGVTHIDTALIYGPYVSEDFIGDFLRKNPAARKQFSIATKGGIVPNPRKFDNSPAFLRECLDGSLKRLGVDHVDLYYVHRRDQTIPIEDVTGTLVAFKNEGKIGGFGFSEISPSSLERAASVHPVAAVQSEYSLWSRQPELGMLQACKRLGTTFVAFSPVARGVPDRPGARSRDIRGYGFPQTQSAL